MKRKEKPKKSGDRMMNPHDGSRRRTTQVHKAKNKYNRNKYKKYRQKLDIDEDY